MQPSMSKVMMIKNSDKQQTISNPPTNQPAPPPKGGA